MKKRSERSLMTAAEYGESFEVWSRAWDAQRSEDQRAGRPYDRVRLEEAARAARRRYVEAITRGRAPAAVDAIEARP